MKKQIKVIQIKRPFPMFFVMTTILLMIRQAWNANIAAFRGADSVSWIGWNSGISREWMGLKVKKAFRANKGILNDPKQNTNDPQRLKIVIERTLMTQNNKKYFFTTQWPKNKKYSNHEICHSDQLKFSKYSSRGILLSFSSQRN